VQLLPFLEEGSLHARFDATKPLADETNKAFREARVAGFVCPSMVLPSPPPLPGWSSYALCTGSGYGHSVNSWHPEYHNGAIIQPDRGRVALRNISAADGTTKTFLGGELDYGLGLIPGFGTGGWPIAPMARSSPRCHEIRADGPGELDFTLTMKPATTP